MADSSVRQHPAGGFQLGRRLAAVRAVHTVNIGSRSIAKRPISTEHCGIDQGGHDRRRRPRRTRQTIHDYLGIRENVEQPAFWSSGLSSRRLMACAPACRWGGRRMTSRAIASEAATDGGRHDRRGFGTWASRGAPTSSCRHRGVRWAVGRRRVSRCHPHCGRRQRPGEAGADPEDTPGRARRTGGAHPSAGESTKWSTQSRAEGPGLLDWAVDQERATSRRHRLVSTLLSPQVDRAAPAGEWGGQVTGRGLPRRPPARSRQRANATGRRDARVAPRPPSLGRLT